MPFLQLNSSVHALTNNHWPFSPFACSAERRSTFGASGQTPVIPDSFMDALMRRERWE
jgi:hypothetical protein